MGICGGNAAFFAFAGPAAKKRERLSAAFRAAGAVFTEPDSRRVLPEKTAGGIPAESVSTESPRHIEAGGI